MPRRSVHPIFPVQMKTPFAFTFLPLPLQQRVDGDVFHLCATNIVIVIFIQIEIMLTC